MKNYAKRSLVLGIIGIITCWVFAGIILGIIGLIPAIKGIKNGVKSIKLFVGMILSLAAIIIGVIFWANMLFTPSDNASNPKPQTEISSEEEVIVEEEPEVPGPQIQSISATYSGSTEEGTVLDNSNDGISVIASYDDGNTENIDNFNISSPATLTAGQSSTVTIDYSGFTCDLTVTCTTLTEDQYKAQCQDISYDELARNPDTYEGQYVKFTGEVIQVQEGILNVFRINVTEDEYGFWDDTVLVYYMYGDGESRILEDDIVTFYGKYNGLETYESILGQSITIPSVGASYIDIN